MYQEWFSSRLSQLRTERKLSARDLSLSLGQSAGYINKIENKKAMPSMQVFFYLCEFFEITPEEFFDRKVNHPLLMNETISELEKLNPNQLEHILHIIKDINVSNATQNSNKKR